MASTLLANLAAYSAQVACLVGAATLLSRLVRIDTPPVRYAYWRGLLALCLALPLLQDRQAIPRARVEITSAASSTSASASPAVPHESPSPIDTSYAVMIVLVGGVLVRLTWTSIGLLRLHQLRAAGRAASQSEEHLALQRALGTRAEIRYIPGLRQPATFGLRWPVVLLPETALHQSSEIQHAVLCHELLHVARRDWAWVIVEELVRAVFWFHPAVWWTISRVQLAREEVVDLDTVRITGGRRTYIEALMAFADAPQIIPAAAFSRRRHLFERILLLSKQTAVSRRRLVVSLTVIVIALSVGGRSAIEAFPLQRLSNGGAVALDTGSGSNRTARPAASSSPTAAPAGSEPAPIANPPAVRQPDTPRRGLEGVDALTRRLQQRAQPTLGTAAQADATLLSASGQNNSVPNAVPQQNPEGDSAAPPLIPPTARDSADAPPLVPDSTTAAQPVRVGGRISAPRKVKHIDPEYPPIAQSARVSGIVIIEATISADGRVQDTRVLRSIPLLDQAALAAVQQWEFEPVLLNGIPVSIVMSVTVNFRLGTDSPVDPGRRQR